MTTATTPPETINPDSPGAAPEPADAAASPDATADAQSPALAELAGRLASIEAAADDLRRMLERSERDRAIDRELLAAGVVDLDAARALVEERTGEGATIVEAVARLRERRPLLFARRSRPVRATAAPAADAPGAPLDELASAARQSGDRRLLLDYLRLRRGGGES